MVLKNRQAAPPLEIDVLGGGTWRLDQAKPKNFTVIVFYRGYHCPFCKRYLTELEGRLADFAAKGIEVIAISADGQDRAEKSRTEWGLPTMKIGYGLTVDQARTWELFVSSAVREAETPTFTEPALYVVRPDGTLFASSIGSAPWARPPIAEIFNALSGAIERGTPARGEA